MDSIDRELVWVAWDDACHEMLEHSIEQLGELAHLFECGWLIKETDSSVTIGVEHQEGMESARLWMTIPRASIKELRRTTVEKAFPKSTIDKSYSPKPARKRKPVAHA